MKFGSCMLDSGVNPPSPRLKSAIMTCLGDTLEEWAQRSQGMMMEVDSVALQYLMFGHRTAFMEFFSGDMFVGIGV